jgi:signal transduction histidine kinase/CheY-like chemotaxis protein
MSINLTRVGDLTVHSSEAITSLRRKVVGTSRLAGFSDVDATRLAVTVSEIGRLMLSANSTSAIGVYLNGKDAIDGLALSFPDIQNIAGILQGSNYFDHLSKSETEQSASVLALKNIRGRSVALNDLKLAQIKELLSRLSRAELTGELRTKNRELEAHQVNLERTVAERTSRLSEANEQLADAREKAVKASETKSAFLANMSHELRTPMNAIIGYSEMLAEDAEDEGHDEMLEDLNKISAAGKHLLSLLNDVLDLSKVEAGKMELFLETFPVTEMANDVANTAVSLIEKNNNKLELAVAEDVGEMRADMTKIRQILFNLISNAAKFTKEGTITLEASREVRGEVPWIRFAVSDTGIGIPEDKLDHIFQEFAQVDDSTTKEYGGTGLGLALTKRFSEMMGGSIKVESEIGVGSSFIITLPAVVEKQHEELEAEAVIESEAPKKVVREEETPTEAIDAKLAGVLSEADKPTALVIDDEKTARDLLRRHLEREGCHVVTASSGSEGLTVAASLRPKLITLDVMMPGMDGWAVLRKLKADPDLKDIPVVMVSMVGDKAMSYALGAVDTMQKPVDRSSLKALVARYSQSKDKSALIVEDDPAARASMKKSLESMKWRVEEAENGAIGLEKIAGKHFGLILLDLMMPVMDGFEFLQRLRQGDSPSAESPVVVVTAMDLDAKDRARLMKNVEEVVSKTDQGINEVMNEVRKSLTAAGLDQADDSDVGVTQD